MQNSELRPLGAGELLDRAVTLFVRRFLPIVVVLAIAIVPLMIAEALLAPNSSRVFTDLGAVMTAGADRGAMRAATEALTRDGAASGQSVLVMMLSLGVHLVMWSAIVALIAAAYAGGTMTFGQAYRIGLRCWPAQLVVGIAFLLIGSAVSIPVFIVYIATIVAVLALVALKAWVVAAIIGILGALITFAGFVVAGAWIFMSYELASVAVVTEGASPVAAITAALRRAFARATWLRTVVGGLIFLAVTEIGALPIALVATMLASVTHLGPLFYAVSGAGTILLDGLVAAFVVVFATDLRVRREGLDLLAMTQPSA